MLEDEGECGWRGQGARFLLKKVLHRPEEEAADDEVSGVQPHHEDVQEPQKKHPGGEEADRGAREAGEEPEEPPEVVL